MVSWAFAFGDRNGDFAAPRMMPRLSRIEADGGRIYACICYK
jgi:hypothetical protein